MLNFYLFAVFNSRHLVVLQSIWCRWMVENSSDEMVGTWKEEDMN